MYTNCSAAFFSGLINNMFITYFFAQCKHWNAIFSFKTKKQSLNHMLPGTTSTLTAFSNVYAYLPTSCIVQGRSYCSFTLSPYLYKSYSSLNLLPLAASTTSLKLLHILMHRYGKLCFLMSLRHLLLLIFFVCPLVLLVLSSLCISKTSLSTFSIWFTNLYIVIMSPLSRVCVYMLLEYVCAHTMM